MGRHGAHPGYLGVSWCHARAQALVGLQDKRESNAVVEVVPLRVLRPEHIKRPWQLPFVKVVLRGEDVAHIHVGTEADPFGVQKLPVDIPTQGGMTAVVLGETESQAVGVSRGTRFAKPRRLAKGYSCTQVGEKARREAAPYTKREWVARNPSAGLIRTFAAGFSNRGRAASIEV